MEFLIRKARLQDLEGAVEAEELAMNGGGYLRDTFDLFFNDRLGELLVAEAPDGEIVACAKYTVVYDGTAWLETLRVKPAYQRRGIGRLFYERFVEISHRLGIDYMRMYTGATNVPSASLARLFGLETEGFYREMNLPLDISEAPAKVEGFETASPERARELLKSVEAQWKGFMVLNRTYYKISNALAEGIAREGKVLEDKSTGSFMVLGNRFLPRRSLQIGLMAGDLQKCLDFAKSQALELGLGNIILEFPPEEEAIQALLEKNGYKGMPSDLQVMGGKVQ